MSNEDLAKMRSKYDLNAKEREAYYSRNVLALQKLARRKIGAKAIRTKYQLK